MSTIEETLKSAYLRNGGTEAGFEKDRPALLDQYRNTAAINAALEEASRPPDMNDLIRRTIDESRDDGVLRLFPNLTGTHNDAA